MGRCDASQKATGCGSCCGGSGAAGVAADAERSAQPCSYGRQRTRHTSPRAAAGRCAGVWRVRQAGSSGGLAGVAPPALLWHPRTSFAWKLATYAAGACWQHSDACTSPVCACALLDCVSALSDNALCQLTLSPHVCVQLVRAGRTVVAAARDADKARAVFTELGLQEGGAAPDGQARTRATVYPGVASSLLGIHILLGLSRAVTCCQAFVREWRGGAERGECHPMIPLVNVPGGRHGSAWLLELTRGA